MQSATTQERLVVKSKAGSPARLVKLTFLNRDNHTGVRCQFQGTTCLLHWHLRYDFDEVISLNHCYMGHKIWNVTARSAFPRGVQLRLVRTNWQATSPYSALQMVTEETAPGEQPARRPYRQWKARHARATSTEEGTSKLRNRCQLGKRARSIVAAEGVSFAEDSKVLVFK